MGGLINNTVLRVVMNGMLSNVHGNTNLKVDSTLE